jgi:Acetoacetate decarboxylase (ADC)
MSAIAFTQTDPFFNVATKTVSTSEGPVELPILYRNVRNLDAFFLVDRIRVRAALDEAGASNLQPTCEWNGKALIGLACFEYLETTIGPYNEIALAVAVVRKDVKPRLGHWLQALGNVDNPDREMGFFVLHMPVTTTAARTAGREIWGFPKFVSLIDFDRSGRSARIRLADPDHLNEASRAIMDLSGNLGVDIPGPSMSLMVYTQCKGQWLRTAINVRGGTSLHAGGGLKLQIGASTHPMARTMIDLGLQGTSPMIVTYTDTFQSRLNGGVALG